MNRFTSFLSGAFLGAGAIEGLTQVAWSSSLTMKSAIPDLTVANVVVAVGAVVCGLVALAVVMREDRRASGAG
jgi:hypothetical protein